jgi:18S rRNA (adenine1779-N6/adenine1780-N6)-dimethyltransferase
VRLCFMRKNKTLSGIFRLKQVLKMLHANFVTFSTEIKPSGGSLRADEVDLGALMADELKQLEGANKAVSKKEKRLIKQQMQKQNAAKAKKQEDSSEGEDSDEEQKSDVDLPAEEEKEEVDEEEEEMEDEEESKSDDPIKCIKAFKKMVVTALIDNEMDQKRACKMEIIDFLNLLKIFNDIGVHFK